MSSLDELVIVEKRKKMKEKYNKISTGMYIRNEVMQFKCFNFFNERMEIWLPDTFVKMPSAIAQVKYPSSQRPQIIMTDLSSSVNFTFSLFDMEIDKEDIEDTCKGFQSIIKKVQPANVFYENDTWELGKTKVSWFDYKASAIDADIYNIVYVTSIGKNILHGIFNCMDQESADWKEAAFQVIQSIKDLTRGEE
ncbi:hypothetical protein [Anaeromicropila populeti]|uniref:Uncharacterized protein n=1 Tax=Anaeromicropila populeti TaxID=37658 RepID=A0A1I6KCT3_9FIRM|nr:hypothetical protein [Anaeromicropila populeti]SFR89053.1 hypothetical protein SAMN05661086_02377 [Anaeromicropila populeti]